MIRSLNLIYLAVLLSAALCHGGPYPPAAGQPGTTAISRDDPNIVAWADGIAEMTIGELVESPETYPAELALGQAMPVSGTPDQRSKHIACLGRGGSITLSFSYGIGDKPGNDFAVFENSLNDGFLELGYVEVSSDGVNFFRFLNHSLTPPPVSSLPMDTTYRRLDTTDISGFAGKYRSGYGTPFDLAELRDVSPFLDVDDVNSVRIVDVVGDSNDVDSFGGPIYDPFPTHGTAGFDLDAIGVINTVYAVEIIDVNDLDEDGVIDANDLQTFFQAWLSGPDDVNWDSRCDIGDPPDNFVDVNDFAIISKKWFVDFE